MGFAMLAMVPSTGFAMPAMAAGAASANSPSPGASRGRAPAASLGGRLRSVARRVSRFRCILCSEISREDLATKKPDPELYARTTRVWQGKCDAFISHSWSDDEGAKWAALQRWRKAFRAKHGREPTVWLDKYCIDQSNKNTDLRCMLLFLGGCNELVVLCGPSLLDRMWCVLELFMFGQMGSGPRALTVLPVFREDHLATDKLALRTAMYAFDVKNCQCFDSEDAGWIMGLLMDAFGNRANINKAFQNLVLGAEGVRGAGAAGSPRSNLLQNDSRQD